MEKTRLGYINWFEPYQGKSAQLPEKYKELGLGSSVILQYAEVLQSRFDNSRFHLYFDNFFTSLSLLCELKNMGINGTATIRENRTRKCPLPSTKAMKKTERGTIKYIKTRDNELIFCKWNDNSVVAVCSNVLPVEPISHVKRFSQREKKQVNINQPNVIKY